MTKMSLRSASIILVGLAAAVLTGCASIPLTTAARLSLMNQQSLLSLDPQQIRVRVAVPSGFEVDVEKTRLTLTVIDSSSEQGSHACRLVLLGTMNGVRPGGLFHSDYPVVAYELALDPESVRDVKEMQKATPPSKDLGFKLDFSSDLALIPKDAGSVRFWVDLKLQSSDAYMVLFDGAEIKLTKAADDS
jgi:hypothetical protein